MPASRARLLITVALAVLLGVATYLASTAGLRSLASSPASAATVPAKVPEFVYNPPETVPTTADYGPVGPVSLVFAGTKVRTGLIGEQDNPWIAVSSQNGAYRAVSAPHRPDPRPGAVTVSPDGTAMAWGYAGGVVLYDAVHDTSRELGGVAVDPVMGRFSPDGRHLAVYDGALRILEVGSGQVVATLSGVSERAAHQAVWTPDGAALTYLDGGTVVTQEWRSGRRTAVDAPIPPDATLAWQPSGKQLAAMVEVRGVRSVEVFDVAPDGVLTHAGKASPDKYAQQRLLGFTGDTEVTVSALSIDTGTLPFIYAMSTVDDSPPTQVMQLSGSGIDWDTLEVAAAPLANGSARFREPNWPVSDPAKLVASILVTVIALGLYLTRRPRKDVRNRR
jgi:WD40 repeat protein